MNAERHVGRLAGEEDLYGLLGVPADAHRDEIRAAYLQVMRRHHPDRRPGDVAAAVVAQRANAAWAVLRDPHLRAAYDRVRRTRVGVTPGAAQAGTIAPSAGRAGAASPLAASYRRRFHRACLRVGVAVLAVGGMLLHATS